jgi:hypothetical protein
MYYMKLGLPPGEKKRIENRALGKIEPNSVITS